MNWEAIGAGAEFVAAIGVIASLIYVGVEVRRNTAQAKLENWSNTVDRFIGVYSQAGNVETANLIVRGRDDYHSLSPGEKMDFGAHLEQLCIALEGLLNVLDNEVHGAEISRAIFMKHIKHHVGCPGGRAWFEEFEKVRGFPTSLSDAIKEAIREPEA